MVHSGTRQAYHVLGSKDNQNWLHRQAPNVQIHSDKQEAHLSHPVQKKKKKTKLKYLSTIFKKVKCHYCSFNSRSLLPFNLFCIICCFLFINYDFLCWFDRFGWNIEYKPYNLLIKTHNENLNDELLNYCKDGNFRGRSRKTTKGAAKGGAKTNPSQTPLNECIYTTKFHQFCKLNRRVCPLDQPFRFWMALNCFHINILAVKSSICKLIKYLDQSLHIYDHSYEVPMK